MNVKKRIKDLEVGDIFVNDGGQQTIHCTVVKKPFTQEDIPGYVNVPVKFKGLGPGGPTVVSRPANLVVELVEKATLGYKKPAQRSDTP